MEVIKDYHKASIDRGRAVLMESYDGRAYLYSILWECNIFGAKFCEPNLMYFEEGKRNIGLKLLAEAEEFSSDLYILMLKEAKDRELLSMKEEKKDE